MWFAHLNAFLGMFSYLANVGGYTLSEFSNTIFLDPHSSITVFAAFMGREVILPKVLQITYAMSVRL